MASRKGSPRQKQIISTENASRAINTAYSHRNNDRQQVHRVPSGDFVESFWRMTNSGFMTRLFAEGRLTRQFPSVFSQSVSSCCIKKNAKRERDLQTHLFQVLRCSFNKAMANKKRRWKGRRQKKNLFGSSCACHSLVSRVESGPFSINWPEESILGVTKEIEG